MLDTTFHHYLSDVAQPECDAQIQIDGIGLVRFSGMEDARIKSALSDEERIMLSDQDRAGEPHKSGSAFGTPGLHTAIYAFEPFSSQLDS